MKFMYSYIFILFTMTGLFTQEFHGIATYKSYRKVDLKMRHDKMSDDMQKRIQEQLRQQFQQEYILKFNGHESEYKKEEKLDKPNPLQSNLVIRVSDDSGITYKNVKENRYTEKKEIFGKIFLIQDTLINPKWQLKGETKNIGEYTCFKAENKREVTIKTLSESGEITTEKKPLITTVWYTPQIPVSNGPADFQGLPGLILEVNDGNLTLVCAKIILSPDEGVSIAEPRKGKVVSREEFREISEKKTQKQMEQFQSRNRKQDD